MAADMRGATCAGTKTSKVPTEVRSLFNTSSVILVSTFFACERAILWVFLKIFARQVHAQKRTSCYKRYYKSTNCYKSVHKWSTSCVHTACSWSVVTSLKQVVNSLQPFCNELDGIIRPV